MLHLEPGQAAGQQQSGDKQRQDGGEKGQSEAYRQTVGSPDGPTHMHQGVDDGRYDDCESEGQVDQEGRLIADALQARALPPLEQRDGREVGGVHHQNSEQAEHDHEQLAHARAHHRGSRLSHVSALSCLAHSP